MRFTFFLLYGLLAFSLQTKASDFFDDLNGSEEFSTNPVNSPAAVSELESSPFPCARIEKNSSEETELKQLSNPVSLSSVEDLESKLGQIRQIFAQAGDRRGIFASIYHEVSKGALDAINSGKFNNEPKVRKVIEEFGKTYFNGLYGHLVGTPIKPEWSLYYEMAANCEVHPLKTCSTAMNTHIVLDLVDALILANVSHDFYDEYIALGDGLVERIPNVAQSLSDDYNISYDEAIGFFRGWLAGKGVNFAVDVVRKAINYVSDSEEEHKEWDAAGTFSMQWLRKGAWSDARSQVPSMVQPPSGGHALRNHKKRMKELSSATIKPKQTWWMTLKWKTYQQAFKVMAFFIDESEVASPTEAE